ncbi:hypothetical protein [Mesorhizobium sp. ES1-4]|uniref:hypothetical protein n=1 Tax=Mesorhizobium sp. ES1-4 TaxID=2876627 RepID=UPI001CCA6368|nr:hypothetical protein [Mesorhizobium sp. ES1-4]MBZ9800087.1 hypothetical protein [Mesorhizobium sp. ES1-4]
MDSLTIQDAFAPYYADRNRASPRDKRLLAKSGPPRQPAAVTLPTNVKLSDNEPDSTTEH